eukprot:gene13491-18101_t
MDIDDDSENDSDYNPENDKEFDQEFDQKKSKTNNQSKSDIISTIQDEKKKRKIESIWESMKSEDHNDMLNKIAKSVSNSHSNNNKLKQVDQQSSAVSASNQKILETIFGKQEASIISRSTLHHENPSKKKKASVNIDAVKEAVKKVKKNMNVTEVRKFAGEEVIVQRKVFTDGSDLSNNNTSSGQAAVTATGSALDNVLDKIKGPKAVSTIAKSSIEWDNFKDQQGLEDDLAVAAKDGFLTKQEFLERCDLRAFENEKTERILKRGIANSSN